MYAKASLHSTANTAEDALKIAAAFPESRDHYDASLYVESARRVVFKNCMEKCELDNTSLPNFNKNFYYNMAEARECLQSCFNHRMVAHFGSAAKRTDGLQFDFEALKREYQNYEKWHPSNMQQEKYMQGFKEVEVQQIIDQLRQKSQTHI